MLSLLVGCSLPPPNLFVMSTYTVTGYGVGLPNLNHVYIGLSHNTSIRLVLLYKILDHCSLNPGPPAVFVILSTIFLLLQGGGGKGGGGEWGEGGRRGEWGV